MENQTNKKQHKQGRKNAAKFIGFILVFCAIFFSLQYLLSPDYDAYNENGEPFLNGGRFYTRAAMNELYSSEDNIDLLFIGSSHMYWQYNPEVFDKQFKLHSFNAGTSAQQLDTSYTMLVEAGKTNDIDEVWLELCPSRRGITFSERTNLSQIYIVSDYMHFGINKIRYLLNASGPEHYVNSFFPLLRNKDKYFDKGFVKNVIKRKLSKDYRNHYIPDFSSESKVKYVGRGYLENTNSVENEDWKTDSRFIPLKDPLFSSEEFFYLDSIVSYCKKNEIKLVLISTPLTNFNIAQYGNYDLGREQIAEFAKKNKLEFYDFNLCRPEYFTCESTKFFDPSHMNRTGAVEYCDLLCKFFSGQISQEELFYDSYQEKLDAMGNRVFGFEYKVEEKGNEKIVHLDPIASAEFPVYVNVKKTPSNGKETQIMQKQLLEDLHFNKGEKGKLTIEVLGDSPNGHITNIIHIDY